MNEIGRVLLAFACGFRRARRILPDRVFDEGAWVTKKSPTIF
jgi:hypothetical protein